MSASISDVAVRAGVSTATVSRVLNGKAVGRIPELTRSRVRNVAAELDYRPSRVARSLKSGRTMNIGVLVSGLRNPLFAELLDTLDELIMASGYDILADTGRRVDNAVRGGLRDWPVDGVLMWSTGHQDIHKLNIQLPEGVPVVYLGQKRYDDADFVAHDTEQGTRLALGHLWDRGHRHIAFVSRPEDDGARPEARRATYTAFCQEKTIRPIIIETERMTEADKGRQSGIRQSGFNVGHYLAGRTARVQPTAVFCNNDLTALSVMNGAMMGGLHVPQDLAVVGFDGIEEGLYHIRALTTAEIPISQMCVNGLDFLLRRIAHNMPGVPQQITLPMTLRVGTTT